MKVLEAIIRTEYQIVWSEFVRIYGKKNEFLKSKYSKVYKELSHMKLKDEIDSMLVLYINDDDLFYDFYVIEEGLRYAIDFVQWDEIICYNIKNLENNSLAAYLASLLKEITFDGFNQESIRSRKKDILDRLSKYTTLEE